MKITTARKVSQAFFFALFVWFCIVNTVGDKFWQLRNWPVNWFLHLDPLAAIGTVLTTHRLYAGFLWSIVTIILTILLGRFFCGWVCPLGSLQHAAGFLANRNRPAAQLIGINRYRKVQGVKYYILAFVLAMAACGSLQTGLLDPIPLLTRIVDMVLLPIVYGLTSAMQRFYQGAFVTFAIFISLVVLCSVVPRFYCRFICPLGALFAVLGRFAIWRIGKSEKSCSNCGGCERACEGGCEPSGTIKTAECVLCLNCLHSCKDDLVGYTTQPSAAGEVASPDISRRGFIFSLAGGVLAVPAVRLGKKLSGEAAGFIRPPGALTEKEFLKRCLKCGQCMRVCPTNVLQPASFESGLEHLWTPVLNNRIGSSGCQLNCVACGAACPTAAIRPITLEEKKGEGKFASIGPIKIGTAFVDRSRCLPWAMDKPCIVCQEVCPVSPKAVYLDQTAGREGKKLQRPYIDMDKCIGCGICEHACPVSGGAVIVRAKI